MSDDLNSSTPIEEPLDSSFPAWIKALRVILKRLVTIHASPDEIWFELNNHFLRFVENCGDQLLLDRAQKIIKLILSDIPSFDSRSNAPLESPFTLSLNIDDLVDKARSGPTIKAEDIH